MQLVELCAGLSALTLYLHGAKPPVSRIGSKTSYSHAIADVLGLIGPPHCHWSARDGYRVLLVDSDPALCNALAWLYNHPALLAKTIDELSLGPPKDCWERAKQLRNQHSRTCWRAAGWWLWTAGARGGIGGPRLSSSNVDGFTPSRKALVRRIKSLRPQPHVEVMCADVADVAPIPGAVVYLDPPYREAQSYGAQLPFDTIRIAQKWADAECLVGVSERFPLHAIGNAVELTAKRRGQARRSLTATTNEWLTIIRSVP